MQLLNGKVESFNDQGWKQKFLLQLEYDVQKKLTQNLDQNYVKTSEFHKQISQLNQPKPVGRLVTQADFQLELTTLKN